MAYNLGSHRPPMANLSGSDAYTFYTWGFLSLSAQLPGHISIDYAEDK